MKCEINQVRTTKTSICILNDYAQHYEMYVYAMLPLNGLLPLNEYSPQQAQLLLQFATPLTIPTPPFCHDIGKGVVPNRVTHSNKRY